MRRRFRLLNVLAAVIAISFAIVTIGGLYASSNIAEVLTAVLLQIVIVTAAVAVIIGILNLLTVHWGRLRRLERGAFYSLVVIASAAAVIVVHFLDIRTNDAAEKPISGAIFEAVQVSLESALAGLMFFFLVYAAYRMMRDRVTISGCLFTMAVLVILGGWLPMRDLEALQNLREWLLEVPVTAGARGLLIGIALGTVTVSLRVLIGQERAYREE